MNPRRRPLPAILAGLVALAATGAADRLAAQQGSDPAPPKRLPYGLPVWHENFPVALELPTPSAAPVYQRSRRQALERVVANLQGNGRREVWQVATEFFDRAPDDAVPVLIAAMDRALGQRMLKDVACNTIDAMGRMGREEFDDALRRALEHPEESVRQAACAALATSGTVETVRRSKAMVLRSMDGRARTAWLRSARLRLGHEAVTIFAEFMVPETPIVVRDQVLREVLQLPAADAAVALERIWEHAAGEFKGIVAAVLHSAGKTTGTLWLHDCLVGDDVNAAVRALAQLRNRELGILREDVLRLSTHNRPEVRLAVAQTLAGVSGEDVDRTFELLAGTEELIETKVVAVRELTRRGRGDAVSALLGEVETATGTRLQLLLRQLAASGDDRAVELLHTRFLSAPADEGRQFLQAIAQCPSPLAADVLLALFLAPDRAVSKPDSLGQQLSTVGYIPVLLPNLRGSELRLCDAFAKLPPGDYVRRSLFLQALSGIAVDRTDAGIRARIFGLLREVLFDTAELPQLRIQALNALALRALDLDDVQRLGRCQETGNEREVPGMRALFKDFLFEFF